MTFSYKATEIQAGGVVWEEGANVASGPHPAPSSSSSWEN